MNGAPMNLSPARIERHARARTLFSSSSASSACGAVSATSAAGVVSSTSAIGCGASSSVGWRDWEVVVGGKVSSRARKAASAQVARAGVGAESVGCVHHRRDPRSCRHGQPHARSHPHSRLSPRLHRAHRYPRRCRRRRRRRRCPAHAPSARSPSPAAAPPPLARPRPPSPRRRTRPR